MRASLFACCLFLATATLFAQVPRPQSSTSANGPRWEKTYGDQYKLRDANGSLRSNTMDLKYLGTDTLAVLDKDSRSIYLLNDFENASTGTSGSATLLSSYVGENFYLTNPYLFTMYLGSYSTTGPFVNIGGSYYCYIESEDATYLLRDIRSYSSWGAQTIRKMDYSAGNIYFYRNIEKKSYGIVVKGETIDYTNATTEQDGNDLIVSISGVPTYRLPNYYSVTSMTVKPAEMYSSSYTSGSTAGSANSGSGCVRGDCQNGYGKWAYAGSDDYYLGFWKNGKKTGYGMYMWEGTGKYIGNWENDGMNGYGVYIAENEDNIVGWYQNGNLNGLGVAKTSDSWKQGWFSNGNVSTAYDFYTNNTSTGCTAGDCQNKYGRYKWSNGDEYTGFWKNGKMHMGTYKFANGGKYSGMFNSNNQFHGMGRYFFEDGAYYGGNWRDGKYHGIGDYSDKDYNIKAGEWSNGTLIRKMEY